MEESYDGRLHSPQFPASNIHRTIQWYNNFSPINWRKNFTPGQTRETFDCMILEFLPNGELRATREGERERENRTYEKLRKKGREET